MNRNKELLLDKILKNDVSIGILGLGYVGLPLAVLFTGNGIRVLGFDTSEEKIKKVNQNEYESMDADIEELRHAVREGTLSATTDFSRIKECDAIIICVPTPLDEFKKPDMSYIERACVDIGKNMKNGVLISLESTTYPTTTEAYMLPIIEKNSGFKHGRDFWLCYSPERIDPGNKDYKIEDIPKVIGGMDGDAKEIAIALYGKVMKHVHPVSSPRIAEMVKILENTYRLVNISLMNELALLSGKMDIDIWEVIDAAKTKPYGFHAFYPGPGIGGHCIPLDPFYLEHIAKIYNFDLTMIHAAGHINNLMPHRMTVKIASALNRQKKCINGSKILFLGVSYKPDINDARESPALKIIDEVAKKGGNVYYHDPYIPEITTAKGRIYNNMELTDKELDSSDCVVITTNHSCFNSDYIKSKSKLIVDLRNAVKDKLDNVYKL